MASPFSVFRKNRTMLLVVLTILSMFGFVFLPIVMQMGGYGSPSDPVVVKSKYGNLHMSDLHNLRTQRQRVTGVLSDAVMALGANQQQARQYMEGMFGPATDEGLIDSWLLANYAHQMGMVVSDDVVNGFLRQVTYNRVKSDDFKKAFQRAGISETRFFAEMREELLPLQLKKTFSYSLEATTPAERWKYFSRVNQQATIEAVPVPVARYVDRVPEPGPADLKTLFEENKGNDPNPDSPTPGFHEPKRIEMQYFKADYAKLLASVTDEQVKARYEKEKATYDQMDKQSPLQGIEEKGPAEVPKTATPAEKPATTEKPAAPKAEKAATPEAPKKAETPPKATPAAPASTPAAKPETKPEEKKPADKKPDEKKKVSDGAPASQRRSPFMLTAFVAEEKAKPADAKQDAAAAKPASAADVKPAKAAETPAKPADAKDTKAAEKPAKAAEVKDAKAAEKPAKAPEIKDAKAAVPPAKKAEVTAPKPETKPAEAKTGPSDRVKTLIRQQIVGEKLQKAFENLRDQIDHYRTARGRYEDARIKGTAPAEPPKLDLDALARQANQTVGVPGGLVPGAVNWISQADARHNEFFNSTVEGSQPVWAFAFASLSNYRPEISHDHNGNYYLFWKMGEKPAREPKFDDPGVAAEVLRAWKMIQARKLALDEAKNLAEEARKSKSSLKQVFANRPDLPVVAPGPFSWLTFGQVPMGSSPESVRMSSVPGVDMAGTEFMETVFNMSPGDVGTALNAPKTVAYVVRLTALTPSQDALWTQFKVDDSSKYESAAAESQRQTYTAWIKELKTAANLELTKALTSNQQATGRQPSPVSRDDSDADY